MTRIVRVPTSRLATNRSHVATPASAVVNLNAASRTVNSPWSDRLQRGSTTSSTAATKHQMVTSLNSRTPLLGSSGAAGVTTGLMARQSPRDSQLATTIMMESLCSWYQHKKDAGAGGVGAGARPGSRRKCYRMKALQVLITRCGANALLRRCSDADDRLLRISRRFNVGCLLGSCSWGVLILMTCE